MTPTHDGAGAPSGRWPDLHRKVVLTYDNRKITDGAGAQLQRLYGIYAVAKFLGAAYLHTPLASVDNQGLSALEQKVTDPDYHRQLNELVRIPSDVMPAGDMNRIERGNIDLDAVDQLAAAFDAGATGGRPSLVQLVVPYGIADQFPDCYEACKAISPYSSSVRGGRALRVALHVRRGELLVVDPGRLLPNAYYVRVARHVAQILDGLDIDYQLELHTETVRRKFSVPPGYPGLPDRVARMLLTPDMYRLDEFDLLPDLVRCLNDDVLDCLRKLATADVLVMSRSSFSYVAAILNTTGIILCYPFWHSALSSWLTVDPDGQFDRSAFGTAVGALRAGA